MPHHDTFLFLSQRIITYYMRVLFSEIRYVKYAYFTISYNVRSNYGLNLLFAEHCGCSVGYLSNSLYFGAAAAADKHHAAW